VVVAPHRQVVVLTPKIFDQAKEQALQKATQAVADLNALGLIISYRLTIGNAKGEERQLKKATAKPR
jgi:hypothetical protein